MAEGLLVKFLWRSKEVGGIAGQVWRRIWSNGNQSRQNCLSCWTKHFSLAPEVFGVLCCPTGTAYLPNVTCYLFVLSIEQFVCPCASFCRRSWDIWKEAYSGWGGKRPFSKRKLIFHFDLVCSILYAIWQVWSCFSNLLLLFCMGERWPWSNRGAPHLVEIQLHDVAFHKTDGFVGKTTPSSICCWLMLTWEGAEHCRQLLQVSRHQLLILALT